MGRTIAELSPAVHLYRRQPTAAFRHDVRATHPTPAVCADAVQRLEAWALVAKRYRRQGLIGSGDHRRWWYTIHDAAPRTTTFLAGSPRRRGTITVVFDSPLGLPADQLYADRLTALRRDDRRLCEITSFAQEVPEPIDLAAVMELFRHVWLTATRLEGATDMLITVHPHHASFYRRRLLFESLGSVRAYAKVNHAPALLMRTDLTTYAAHCREAFGAQASGPPWWFLDDPRLPSLTAAIDRARGPLDPATFLRFFAVERDLLTGLDPGPRTWLLARYAGVAGDGNAEQAA